MKALSMAAALLSLLGCGGSAGPRMVKDIAEGSRSSLPGGFASADGLAYFTAAGGLWTSDGTETGTREVRPDLDGLGPTAAVGRTLYFAAGDPVHGVELWKSDGTADGTALVKDVNPGPGSQSTGAARGDSYPREITAVAGTVFFAACDGTTGWGLWRSDGTEAGTTHLDGIDPRPLPAPGRGADGCLVPNREIRDLTDFGGLLYFLADDGGERLGLWRSDGTSPGTFLVRAVPRVRPGPLTTLPAPTALTKAAGRLFFLNGGTLWMSDGTGAGTVPLAPVSAALLAGAPTLLYFVWEGGVGRSDGTASGTFVLRDVHVPTDTRFHSRLTELATVGDRLFVLTADPSATVLWTSDGTTAGTTRVDDLASTGQGPFSLTVVGDRLYFLAEDAGHGRQVWRADASGRVSRETDISGQAAPDYDVTGRRAIGCAAGLVLFPGHDAGHGTELWATTLR
jgi:ELWxxDGT repeat protein